MAQKSPNSFRKIHVLILLWVEQLRIISYDFQNQRTVMNMTTQMYVQVLSRKSIASFNDKEATKKKASEEKLASCVGKYHSLLTRIVIIT